MLKLILINLFGKYCSLFILLPTLFWEVCGKNSKMMIFGSFFSNKKKIGLQGNLQASMLNLSNCLIPTVIVLKKIV